MFAGGQDGELDEAAIEGDASFHMATLTAARYELVPRSGLLVLLDYMYGCSAAEVARLTLCTVLRKTHTYGWACAAL